MENEAGGFCAKNFFLLNGAVGSVTITPGMGRETALRVRRECRATAKGNSQMEISTREKILQIVSRYVIITLSISIMTIGVYFFKFPNNFVFGGVTGGAALVAKLTPLSASAFSSGANILLLILGWIFLGRDFAISTGWATVVMTAELALFEKYVPLSGPLSDQPMLDLVFAIALPAIASALLFNVGASSGGTDVVALILKKYAHMQNTGEALFITDLAMVLAACFVFDLYTALYSFVGLTVKSLVVDAVLEQMKMCKAILIICDDKDPICDFVMRKLVRGATYTPCYGAYTDRPHYMIYTTLTHREALQLQAFIHKENLNAFISMLSTTEVFGKGFNHA